MSNCGTHVWCSFCFVFLSASGEIKVVHRNILAKVWFLWKKLAICYIPCKWIQTLRIVPQWFGVCIGPRSLMSILHSNTGPSWNGSSKELWQDFQVCVQYQESSTHLWCGFLCHGCIAGIFSQPFEFTELNLFNYSGDYGRHTA